MAASKSQVKQAKSMAAEGASAKKIEKKTGVSSDRAAALNAKAGASSKSLNIGSASTPTYTNSAGDVIQQQATLASSPVAQERFNSLQNIYGDKLQSQFIPGLMVPGQKGYDKATGGGNWAFAQGKIDPEALRAFYRTGSTDLTEADRSKYTLDALNTASTAAPTSMATKQQSSKKKKANFANAGANISKNEALKIAKAKGISVAEVMDRGLGKGRTLGASLVNQYNSGKLDGRSYIQRATDAVFGKMGAKSQYQPESLTRLNTFGKMPKGSTYGGMTSTGTPVLGTKMPKDLINAKPQTTGGGPYDGTEIKPFDSSGPGPLASGTGAETAPILPEKEDQMMMPGIGADVSSFATGWKSRLSSRRGKGASAQGLASQRLGPVGKWQYNV